MERSRGTVRLFRKAHLLARELGFELNEASTAADRMAISPRRSASPRSTAWVLWAKARTRGTNRSSSSTWRPHALLRHAGQRMRADSKFSMRPHRVGPRLDTLPLGIHPGSGLVMNRFALALILAAAALAASAQTPSKPTTSKTPAAKSSSPAAPASATKPSPPRPPAPWIKLLLA